MYEVSGEMSKAQLADKLATILGDVVTYKFMAQGFHWNVKGPNFPQFHDFFGELYEDAEGSIDPLGESIRKLGFDAPYALQDLMTLSQIDARQLAGDPIEMARELYLANAHIADSYNHAFHIASALNFQGIADFIAGRIDVHEKYMWQLSTITGDDSMSIGTLGV